LSVIAPLRQALTQAPQPVQRAASTPTREATTASAPCGQTSVHGRAGPRPSQQSADQMATGCGGGPVSLKRSRRETAAFARLSARSSTGAAVRAADTRAIAARNLATPCSPARAGSARGAGERSTTRTPEGCMPAPRSTLRIRWPRSLALEHPTTTRSAWARRATWGRSEKRAHRSFTATTRVAVPGPQSAAETAPRSSARSGRPRVSEHRATTTVAGAPRSPAAAGPTPAAQPGAWLAELAGPPEAGAPRSPCNEAPQSRLS